MTNNPDRWQHLEPFISKLFKERIQRYDEIMAMREDIFTIATTYNLPVETVQRAKNHAFGEGVSRHCLLPDNDMAAAWLRLATGQGNSLDKVFLEHEIYESSLVEDQGLSQKEAHDLTQLKFPWSILLRESQQ